MLKPQFLYVCIGCLVSVSYPLHNNFDTARYEEGKQQFSLINQKSEMPRYGICWKNAMMRIQTGCKRLTDEVQSRLALAYLNCFLTIQGRDIYECESDKTVAKCTSNMADVDRGSLTTMFTHTQNICYFLQAQIWHEEMDFTIDRLANSSSYVGDQLEESVRLQMDMIQQQNESLRSQQRIINQTLDLRLLITDVFEKVTKLQSLVLGEFSGFYSIIYYTFSILLCYLLTSTPRTGGARFWLFGAMTLNMLLEQLIIIYAPEFFISSFDIFMPFKDEEELIYWSQRLLRKVSVVAAITILGVCAYSYQDMNTINNALLADIRRQNSEIKRMFLGAGISPPNQTPTSQPVFDLLDAKEIKSPAADSTTYDSSISGYSSDTASSSIGDTDKTFSLHEEADEEDHTSHIETDSFVTITTDTGNQSLLNELNHLRNSTPIRQLANQVSSWVDTGFYKFSKKKEGSDAVGSSSDERIQSEPRYNLRPRRGRTLANPTIDIESPKTFHKEVKRLAKVSRRNNHRTQVVINRNKNLSLFSDDD